MNYKKVKKTLDKLNSNINNHTISNPQVSKSSIGWHIDHSLKVINNVIIALHKSNPELYKKNFSFLGKVFFMLGFFPRGKAKAPKQVKPPEIILKEDIISQMQLAKTNVETISKLHKNAFFKHPFFGDINSKRIYRFLELHTNHHLKIIDDILKK
ncbi:DUF1569 domain-containing protein [Lacinutrix venerupis]|uniref:DUF1569 domain-containing protein n=1 Tax=Lacinutrix venerupis TaxID=1486034 RepID=A0AAC9LLW1_9FLAO|nr:DUF1569 domain-containing protein [Lacinutrix venerupis]APX99146.1 DUF1569 domain-containing protein [Lacinutrix venerupis]